MHFANKRSFLQDHIMRKETRIHWLSLAMPVKMLSVLLNRGSASESKNNNFNVMDTVSKCLL